MRTWMMIAGVALLTTACTTGLNNEDRALLEGVKTTAEEAKALAMDARDAAAKASHDAAAARQAAQAAAKDASMSSEKADRIFQKNQYK